MSLSTTGPDQSGQHSQQEIASAVHNAVIIKHQQEYADHWRQIKPLTGPASISCIVFDLTIRSNQSIPHSPPYPNPRQAFRLTDYPPSLPPGSIHT